jgi:hypothetical protein
MFDAQMREGASNLREMRSVDLSASNDCGKIMAAPIRIKAQRQAIPAPHFLQGPLQGPERRRRAFLFDQKGRKKSARRIVQRDDRIERRLAGKPFVPGGS